MCVPLHVIESQRSHRQASNHVDRGERTVFMGRRVSESFLTIKEQRTHSTQRQIHIRCRRK